MPIRVLKKDKDKKEEQKEKPKSGSSVKDIFKSYGKYDGKPIELKRGGLSPKQKAIAAKAPPPDKIDAKDFAVLKKEKAKGRGMGLQDEKIKPGKVMKARYGTAIMTIAEKAMSGAKSYKNYLKGLKKATSERRSEVIKSPEYSPSNYKGTKSYKALGIKNEDEFYKIKMKDPKFAGAVYKTAGSKKIPAAVDNRIRQLNANIRMDKINQNPKAKKMYEEGVTFGKKTRKMAGGMAMKAKTGKQIVKEFSAALKGIDESFKSKVHPMKKQRLMDSNKVMTKAKYGKMMKAKRGMLFSEKMTLQDAKVIDKKTGKTHLSKNQLDDYLKNQKDPKLQKMGRLEKKYIQQRPGMAPKSLPVAKNILNAAKATKYGKIALGIAGVALGAKELLKSKMKKEDKKMVGGMAKKYSVGGGMMQRPMGYSSGSKLMDFIKSGSYTDKYGTKTNVDKAIKKINLSPKDKDLATMKPASDKKMMGGGMMNKPMGYKSGTMVKARGCKLGRTRPTKMY